MEARGGSPLRSSRPRPRLSLLARLFSPDSGIANNSNAHAGGEAGQTAAQTGGEVGEAREEGVLKGLDGGTVGINARLGLCDGALDDHRHDEAVDTQHSSHDNRDDVLHNEVGVHHTHGRKADAGLGGSVGGSDVGENKGGGDSHEAEEGSGGGADLRHRRKEV